MSDSNRSLFQVHFHSHGGVQLGPRSLGRGRESEESMMESGEDAETGLSVGAMALLVFGLAVGVALVRRRRQRRARTEPEQKNLDRWIPTR